MRHNQFVREMAEGTEPKTQTEDMSEESPKCPMSPEELEDLKKRSEFSVHFADTSKIPSIKLMSEYNTMKRYDENKPGYGDCEFFDRKSGIYSIPVTGIFEFSVQIKQLNNGEMDVWTHIPQIRMHYLYGKLKNGGDTVDHAREQICKEGETVSLDVRRLQRGASILKGSKKWAQVAECTFSGRLLRLNETD